MDQLHLQRFRPEVERRTGEQDWYVGDEADCIAFNSQILPNGRVALRSVLFSDTLGLNETFLFEVVDRHEALDCASSMVLDAVHYLEEVTGHPADEGTGEDFVDHLQQVLGAGLH